MGRKERSLLVLSAVAAMVTCLIMIPLLLPAGASGELDGQGVKWRSSGLYRVPLGADDHGNVYVMTDTPGDPVCTGDPTLISMDVNGTKRWEYRVHGYGLNAMVGSDGRTCLLESDGEGTYGYGRDHILTVLDPDGARTLSLDLSSRHNDTDRFKLLHAVAGTIYYAAVKAANENVSAVCAVGLDGTERWSAALPGAALSGSTWRSSEDLMVMVTDKGVFFLDADGAIVRSVNVTDGRIIAAPSVSRNGTVCMAVHHGDMFLPNEIWAVGPDGSTLWARSILPGVDYAMDCAVIDMLLSSDGTLYVATTGGTRTGAPIASYDPFNTTGWEDRWIPPRLLAFEPGGQTAWTHDLSDEVRGRMAEVDGKVVACTHPGILVLAPDGAIVDRYSPPRGYLAGMFLSDGAHFHFVEVTNPGVVLAFSDGLPHATVLDWLLAYRLITVLASITVVLSLLVFVLHRRRRRRAGR